MLQRQRWHHFPLKTTKEAGCPAGIRADGRKMRKIGREEEKREAAREAQQEEMSGKRQADVEVPGGT